MDFLTCQTSWREVNNQCNHINCQLELYEFLDIYVNWTSPFGHRHNCGEIIIQNYDISALFSHLNLVKVSCNSCSTVIIKNQKNYKNLNQWETPYHSIKYRSVNKMTNYVPTLLHQLPTLFSHFRRVRDIFPSKRMSIMSLYNIVSINPQYR